MFPAPAPMSQPRWKPFHALLLSSQKKGRWQGLQERQIYNHEAGWEGKEILYAETLTSATANLSNVVVQILQNIQTTGI